MAVSYVDRQAFSFLSVKVTEDLDISNAEYGWLLLAFSLAYPVGTPLGGWGVGPRGAAGRAAALLPERAPHAVRAADRARDRRGAELPGLGADGVPGAAAGGAVARVRRAVHRLRAGADSRAHRLRAAR